MEKQIVKKEISYIHNGNVTVCMVKFWLSEDFLNEIINDYLDDRFKINNYIDPLVVKGISKCEERDVYDVNKGDKIARIKAINKMNRKLNKINSAIAHYYREKCYIFQEKIYG